MRTYVRMVVCVYLPRFELSVAVGDRSSARQALGGRALAVAPLAGTEQRVGEVSGTAEAFGVLRGMVLGEALARCSELVLVPADSVGVAEAWESVWGRHRAPGGGPRRHPKASRMRPAFGRARGDRRRCARIPVYGRGARARRRLRWPHPRHGRPRWRGPGWRRSGVERPPPPAVTGRERVCSGWPRGARVRHRRARRRLVAGWAPASPRWPPDGHCRPRSVT